MARFSVAFRTTGAATALLPMGSLYATAAIRPVLVECGVFNTTVTAVNVALCRLTTAGTSSAVTTSLISYENDDSQAAIASPRQTHSSTGPTITSVPRTADLGAAIGSGVIWTFGTGRGSGMVIPAATTNGIGVYTPNGTGQICDIYFVWDE
jgi:hypothetical protein